MTIQAQPTDNPSGAGRAHEHPTHGLDPSEAAGHSAIALLDPRTRGRSIARDQAPPGRYLSIEDNDEVLLIPLERPITHIGRGLTSDIRLEDANVSRRHAIVAQRGDGVRVLDDRSANGTFLNGRPVTIAYLADGDVLRVGRVVLRFVVIPPNLKATPTRRRIPLPVRAPGGVFGSAA
jgi:pSer/pThr/pTyr-binding forkhead associated (FHA) protein